MATFKCVRWSRTLPLSLLLLHTCTPWTQGYAKLTALCSLSKHINFKMKTYSDKLCRVLLCAEVTALTTAMNAAASTGASHHFFTPLNECICLVCVFFVCWSPSLFHVFAWLEFNLILFLDSLLQRNEQGAQTKEEESRGKMKKRRRKKQ